MTPKIDKNGFEYFDHLPEGYRTAVANDFHLNGRKKIGMTFLIKWIIREDYYQVCTVSENLKGEKLRPFLEIGRVFVKDNQ